MKILQRFSCFIPKVNKFYSIVYTFIMLTLHNCVSYDISIQKDAIFRNSEYPIANFNLRWTLSSCTIWSADVHTGVSILFVRNTGCFQWVLELKLWYRIYVYRCRAFYVWTSTATYLAIYHLPSKPSVYILKKWHFLQSVLRKGLPSYID